MKPWPRGFTYLWLLFVLAASGSGLALLGQRASQASQREREAELVFRGRQIAQALSTYRAATPGKVKLLPSTLQDLLEDRRGPKPLRHLRRVYDDPFTGRPDWTLVLTPDERIAGVRSSSRVDALHTVDLPRAAPGQRVCVCDRVFMFSRLEASSASASAAARAALPASAASPSTSADEEEEGASAASR